MRPHTLLMKAFGPFAGETNVDFDAMGNTVYLIAGDTGSGKTTIFDAIVYALYGKASGDGRSRLNTEDLHSDYAKNGDVREEMRVEFTFSQAGRTFTVSRRMNWGKSGAAGKSEKSSCLTENGRTVVTGRGTEERDDVTQKIKEILGLDADQFRRIIMLAQGEFQRFLNADPKERGEILGKLYKNERQQDFQLRLQAADEKLKNREDSVSVFAAQRLGDFRIPEAFPEEKRAALAADNAEVLPAMREALALEKEALADTEERLRAAEKERQALADEKTRGEKQNELLRKAAEATAKREKLEQDRARIEALRVQRALAENASAVLPEETAFRTASSALAGTEESIGQLQTDIERHQKEEAVLSTEAEQCRASLEKENETLQKELTLLNNAMPLYAALREKQTALAAREKESAAADRALEAAERSLRETESRLGGLRETLARLAEAGQGAVDAAAANLKALEEKKAALAGLDVGIAAVNVLAEREKTLQAQLDRRLRESREALADYDRLHSAYIAGQSGLLARELKEQIEKEGTAACPVCGTVHTAADSGAFAALSGDVPAREKVDGALQALDRANAAEKKAAEERSAAESERKIWQENVLREAAKQLGTDDPETVFRGDAVREAAGTCRKEIAAAEQALLTAEKDKKDKEAAAREKEAAEKEKETAENKIRELRTAAEEARSAVAAARAGTDAARAQLASFPATAAEAEQKAGTLEKRIAANRDRVRASEQKLTDCRNETGRLRGSLAAQQENGKKQRLEKDAAEERYSAALTANGFADGEAYLAARSPAGSLLDKDALRNWIRETDRTTARFDEDLRAAESEEKTFKAAAEGRPFADIAALEEKIRLSEEKHAALEQERRDLDCGIANNSVIAADVEKYLAERRKISAAREKVHPLAAAAAGKLPFSRYVLRDFYRSIIEQANLYLETMTDGEYVLRAVDDGDARKGLGLNLSVENTLTGRERDTRTLSGGQTFEASLSLALGLSEIVRMESTSVVQIDSLFIDEGFGSLDGLRLEKALKVLDSLSAEQKQIGVISHVPRLEELLGRKIVVSAGEHGSRVETVTDV